MQPPDARGYFGAFGGQYVPEVLYQAVRDLAEAVDRAFGNPTFWQQYQAILQNYVGRPSPLYHAQRFPTTAATVLFKREDLNHTGAHKVNNAVGQGLLAQRMGMKRLIAETGAGQHGVATATIGAKLGLPVEVYMGELDIERQAMNVATMRLLGATIHPVESGTRTLKDAVNAAIREWATRATDTFYVIGSVVGPHPYPYLVREFQKVIGVEARRQCLEQWGRLPTDVIACVGGGATRSGSSLASSATRASGCGARKPPVAVAGRATTPPRCRTGRWGSSTVPSHISSRTATAKWWAPTRSALGWTTPAWGRSMRCSRRVAGPSTWG